MGFYSLCPVLDAYYTIKNKIFSPKPSTVNISDIIRTLDYINYDNTLLLNNYNHIKALGMYIGMCNLIFDFFKSEWNYLDTFLYDKGMLYGVIGNDIEYKGFCGWEEDFMAWRLYINLDMVPYGPSQKLFAYIFDIAKHEMSHLFLNALQPIAYSLSDHVHDVEFVSISSEIDTYFYNRKDVLAKINKLIVKK